MHEERERRESKEKRKEEKRREKIEEKKMESAEQMETYPCTIFGRLISLALMKGVCDYVSVKTLASVP